MTHIERVELLQRNLAEMDFRTEPRRLSRPGAMGFALLKLKEIKLKMYQETGHAMPHIHIDYGTKLHGASFSIDNPSRIAGSPSKYDKLIIAWIAENNEILLKIWKEVQAGGTPDNLVAQLPGNV